MSDPDDWGGGDIVTPNAVDLPDGKIHHNVNDVWQCRVCGYNRNCDARSPACIQCGRDFWGNPGSVPDRQELAKADLQSRK